MKKKTSELYNNLQSTQKRTARDSRALFGDPSSPIWAGLDRKVDGGKGRTRPLKQIAFIRTKLVWIDDESLAKGRICHQGAVRTR